MEPSPFYDIAVGTHCTAIGRVCFVGEAIVVHTAKDYNATLTRLMRPTRDPLDNTRQLHPERHNTVLLAPADRAFDYVPLAVPISPRADDVQKVRWRAPSRAEEFSRDRALVFFSTYPASISESFVRSVLRLFEYSLRHPPASLHLRPSFWMEGDESFDALLAPFTHHRVQPLGLFPRASLFAGHAVVDDFRRQRFEPGVFEAYERASREWMRRRTAPHCHEAADVCNWAWYPHLPHMRPWSAMHAVLRHLSPDASTRGPAAAQPARLGACDWAPPTGGGRVTERVAPRLPSCKLRVAFAERQGHRMRRKLLNIDELVAACNAAWPTRVECGKVRLSGGLRYALRLLGATDVLVSPHGADLINGLVMHNGASVVELMPEVTRGCPCGMFRQLYSDPLDDAGRVFYWRVDAQRNSTPPTDPHRGTFHADLRVAWASLAPALEAIWRVGGRESRYLNASLHLVQPTAPPRPAARAGPAFETPSHQGVRRSTAPLALSVQAAKERIEVLEMKMRAASRLGDCALLQRLRQQLLDLR